MVGERPMATPVAQPHTARAERYSLPQLLGYFVRLGTFGFGGPIALCGYMQRDLVERRGWIAPEDYKQGLALAQLAPGPLAAQLRSEERRVGTTDELRAQE